MFQKFKICCAGFATVTFCRDLIVTVKSRSAIASIQPRNTTTMENKVAVVEKKISSIENTLQDINSKLDVANKYKDDGKDKNEAFFHFQQDLLTQVKYRMIFSSTNPIR